MLAHINTVHRQRQGASHFKKYSADLNKSNIQLSMKVNDMPETDSLNDLKIKVFDLTSVSNFQAIYINKN